MIKLEVGQVWENKDYRRTVFSITNDIVTASSLSIAKTGYVPVTVTHRKNEFISLLVTYGYQLVRTTVLDESVPTPNIFKQTGVITGNPNCMHEYKHYQGLMESYHYCVKCDEKESV